MKPTQEQVIQWAHEAGLHIATDVHWMPIIGLEYLEKATALAYEAGRKDENESCEKLHEEMWASSVSADSTVEAFNGALKGYARVIRARREQ